MTQPKILSIEDDAAIRRGIVDALRFAGYAVLQSGDGREGLEMALRQEYDLLLLDLVLPGLSGLDILREVRRIRPTQPVIILSARGEEDDRVAGLKLGADDYVVKPFGVKELLARVEAVLRRSPQRPSDLPGVAIPGGQADFARREIRFADGQRVELSERESELLRYLVANRGRAITREELLDGVWRIAPQGVTTRTIDMHIARLREKLRDDSDAPRVLLTVRGTGYMFAAEAETAADRPADRPWTGSSSARARP
jgi:DNA-binding response OmpR family regulator